MSLFTLTLKIINVNNCKGVTENVNPDSNQSLLCKVNFVSLPKLFFINLKALEDVKFETYPTGTIDGIRIQCMCSFLVLAYVFSTLPDLALKAGI